MGQSQVLFGLSSFTARCRRDGNESSSPVAARMDPELLDYFCSGLLSEGPSNGPSLLSAEAVISCCSPEAGLQSQQPLKGISFKYFIKCSLLQTIFLFTNCKLWVFKLFQLNLF